jgi:hypothetical protein
MNLKGLGRKQEVYFKVLSQHLPVETEEKLAEIQTRH